MNAIRFGCATEKTMNHQARFRRPFPKDTDFPYSAGNLFHPNALDDDDR
jgi:hypothetical protein